MEKSKRRETGKGAPRMYKNKLSRSQLKAACKELEKLVHEELEDPRVVARGKMILACLQGLPTETIMREFAVSRSMIFRWRARYFQDGIAGLRDKPRCGKPPKYDQDFENQVLNLLSEMPPDGMASWDGPALAKQLSASNDAVWRVLRKHHISLARQREWNVDARLNLPQGFPVVAGIYIGPPVWMAVVLEEKNQSGRAQVITRERQAGKALRQAADQAGGILAMQEAIRIMASQSENPAADYTRRMEIVSFLDDTVAAAAEGGQVYVHVVGSAAQLGIANWLATHSDVTMSFYSTLEEGVRAVKKMLPEYTPSRHSTFLAQAASYPATAHPFIWKRIRMEN